MRVLVDGYNVLFTLNLLPRQKETALQAGRQTLLDLIRQHLGAAARDVMVVFDAGRAPKGVLGDYAYHGIEVVFAKERKEADDLIEALIRQASVPRRLTVVSSDQRLRQAATRRGAQAVRAEDFLEWMEKQAVASQPTPPVSGEAESAELLPEESARWLREFGHLDADPELGQPMFPPECFELDDDEPEQRSPSRR